MTHRNVVHIKNTNFLTVKGIIIFAQVLINLFFVCKIILYLDFLNFYVVKHIYLWVLSF